MATCTPPPPKFSMASSLTASSLWLLHSLHYQPGKLCSPLPSKNSASSPYSFCPLRLVTGVPPIQAPSWQHLPEDFSKNLGNLPRALDHSLGKAKAGNMASLAPGSPACLPLRRGITDAPTVASSCFCYVLSSLLLRESLGKLMKTQDFFHCF